MLLGGWTCPNCGCETDRKGRELLIEGNSTARNLIAMLLAIILFGGLAISLFFTFTRRVDTGLIILAVALGVCLIGQFIIKPPVRGNSKR